MRYQFFSRNPSILMLEIAAGAQFSSMPWMDSRGRIRECFRGREDLLPGWYYMRLPQGIRDVLKKLLLNGRLEGGRQNIEASGYIFQSLFTVEQMREA